MIDVTEIPKARPYAAHGVDFKRQTGNELIADCPFSGKRDKFYLNVHTGAWHSKTLGLGGGLSRFFALVMETYWDVRELPSLMATLAKHRQLPLDAFKGWRIGWDGQRYVFPISDPKNRLKDLRTYHPQKRIMRSTAGCAVGLMGAQHLGDEARKNEPVYLCEGEWDAIAMQWLLRKTGQPGIAIGLPGAGTFKEEWVDWFRGRDVHTMYDHDEAGEQGELLARKRLTTVVKSISYVYWPEELPKGFDTRDWIIYGAVARDTAPICLERLHKLFRNQPRRDRAQAREVVVAKTGGGSKPVTLAQVHQTFRKWLHLENTDAIDVMLATAFALKIEGPPIWMFLVAPPGGAKTVLLMSLEKWVQCYPTSSLTPHSLISGANWQGERDPSLIPKLNDKLLAVKDFTVVLGMRDIDQGEVFSIFRDAYDGRCGKVFGNGVERSYISRFGIIAGVTPRIYELSESHSSLGERFLKFSMGDNLQHASEDEIIARAIDNVDRNTRMTAELSDVVAAFLDSPRGPVPDFDEEYAKRVIALSRLGARLRGTVTKDFRGENVIGKPFAEIGSRLGVQLSKIARALAWIYGKTKVGEAEYRLLVKIMLDTVAQRQEDLLRALYKRTGQPGPNGEKLYTTSVELASDTSYPNSTVRRMLDDMLLLQIVEKRGGSFRYSWRLSDYVLKAVTDARLYETPTALTRRAHVVWLRRRSRRPPADEEPD